MGRYIALAAVVIALVLGVAVRAADPSGRWSATFMTQVGEQAYTYEFIVKGTTLAGTAKGSLTGEGKISDGKIDGDTITVLDSENKRIRVRINGIDAPEKGRKPVPGQPYGDMTRQHLIVLTKARRPHTNEHSH